MTKKIIGADDLPDLLNDFNTQLAEKAQQNDLSDLANLVNDKLNNNAAKINTTDFVPPNTIVVNADSNEVLTASNTYTSRSGLPLQSSIASFNFFTVKNMRNFVVIGYQDKTNYVVVEFNQYLMGRVYQVNEIGDLGPILLEYDATYGVINTGDNISCQLTSTYAQFYINGVFRFQIALSILPSGVTPRLGLVVDVSVDANEGFARKARNGLYYSFNSSIKQTDRWSGKVLSCLGDSITYGYGLASGEKQYHALLKDRMNFSTVNNLGVSGTEISTGGTFGADIAFVSRYTQIPTNSDFITVLGGTNDYLHNVPMGDITSTDSGNFYGALKNLLAGLYDTYPSARIIFITPIRTWDNVAGTTDDAQNTQGHTLTDYVNAIKEVCGNYSVPVIDLHTQMGFYMANWKIWGKYTSDGIHPNQLGHTRMADMIEGYFKLF